MTIKELYEVLPKTYLSSDEYDDYTVNVAADLCGDGMGIVSMPVSDIVVSKYNKCVTICAKAEI